MADLSRSHTWKIFCDLFPVFANAVTEAMPSTCIKVEGNSITVEPSTLTTLCFSVEEWEYFATLSTEDGDEEVFSTLRSDPHKVIKVLVAALEEGAREKEAEKEAKLVRQRQEEVASTFVANGFRRDQCLYSESICLRKDIGPELADMAVVITKDMVKFSWGRSSYKPAVTHTRSLLGSWSGSEIKHHHDVVLAEVRAYLLKHMTGSVS